MYELWIKMYDATNQVMTKTFMNPMVAETLADTYDISNSLMQQGAKQGFDLAGPGGGLAGGFWGWTYGSVLGTYLGAGRYGGKALSVAASTAGPRPTNQPSQPGASKSRKGRAAK